MFESAARSAAGAEASAMYIGLHSGVWVVRTVLEHNEPAHRRNLSGDLRHGGVGGSACTRLVAREENPRDFRQLRLLTTTCVSGKQ